MNRSRAIILLVAFALTLLGSSRLVSGRTISQEFPPLSAGEFCAQPGRTELDCPKTGAIRCMCYLRAAQAGEQAGQAPALARPIVVAKVPRKGRQLKVLPESALASLKPSVRQVPPTPPPRP